VGNAVTYGLLKPSIPLAPAGAGFTSRAACDEGRARVEAQHITIGDEYVKEALPVIHRQLAKAAYRLADLLNSTSW
jgi:hypothetical protein